MGIRCWFDSVVSKGGFLHSVLVLVGGAAFAHAITALGLPILTRLYTPDQFSLLAVFSSVLSIIGVAACLRFDIAIPLPERDEDAFSLLILAALSLCVVVVVCSLLVFIVPLPVSQLLGQPGIAQYLWLLPVGIFLVGSYSALQNWYVRKRQFTLIARSRVAQSAASTGAQIGLSVGPFSSVGLIVGLLLNSGAACAALGYRFVKEESVTCNRLGVGWASLKQAFNAYSRFPKYSTWEALCNSAAIQVPLVMIAALAAGPEAGYLLLGMSIIQAPMALFGTSIGQVYLSRAPQEYRNGQLAAFTGEVLGGLCKGGVGPLLTIGILAPAVFGLVFGAGWEHSGWLVAWMTPWFVMQFLTSPLSMALHVIGRQKLALSFQLLGFLVRASTVLVVAELYPRWISESYAISGFVIYALYFWLIAHCTGLRLRDLAEAVRGAGVVIGWVAASLVFLLVLKAVLGLHWAN